MANASNSTPTRLPISQRIFFVIESSSNGYNVLPQLFAQEFSHPLDHVGRLGDHFLRHRFQLFSLDGLQFVFSSFDLGEEVRVTEHLIESLAQERDSLRRDTWRAR